MMLAYKVAFENKLYHVRDEMESSRGISKQIIHVFIRKKGDNGC